MNSEERRIREQHRGSPDYYRKLQEHRIAQSQALSEAEIQMRVSLKSDPAPLALSKELAEAAPKVAEVVSRAPEAASRMLEIVSRMPETVSRMPEAAPITDYYRRLPKRSLQSQPITEVIALRNEPVASDRVSKTSEAVSPGPQSPPPVTDYYRRSQERQAREVPSTAPLATSPQGAEPSTISSEARVAADVEGKTYYQRVYEQQIREGTALPYSLAKARRDRQDLALGRRPARGSLSSPDALDAEEGI